MRALPDREKGRRSRWEKFRGEKRERRVTLGVIKGKITGKEKKLAFVREEAKGNIGHKGKNSLTPCVLITL